MCTLLPWRYGFLPIRILGDVLQQAKLKLERLLTLSATVKVSTQYCTGWLRPLPAYSFCCTHLGSGAQVPRSTPFDVSSHTEPDSSTSM